MTNRTTKHSPDDVHVCVSISHVQPQQGRDVIGGRGRTHIPSDDVHSAGTGCCVISLINNRVLHTWVSQSTHSEWDRRTLVLICTNVSFRCHVRVSYTAHNHRNVIKPDILIHMQRTVHNITELMLLNLKSCIRKCNQSFYVVYYGIIIYCDGILYAGYPGSPVVSEVASSDWKLLCGTSVAADSIIVGY